MNAVTRNRLGYILLVVGILGLVAFIFGLIANPFLVAGFFITGFAGEILTHEIRRVDNGTPST